MSIILLLIVNNVFSEAARGNMQTKPNTKKRIYEVSREVDGGLQHLTSQEEKVTYLQHFIVNEKEEMQRVHFYKASAIRLLGENGGSNAVPILIDNINYEDVRHHDKPSVTALVTIGKPAVQSLLEVVEISESKQSIYHAVQALLKIEGTNYSEFVNQQKDKMSSNVWKNLLKYAIE